ncbi:MAG: tetratricopeptide repeat protein [Syntrophaceae bacterium]
MAAGMNRIHGIFYEESNLTLGTGHTQKNQKLKNYCMADQVDEAQIKLTFLGDDGEPTGIEITMPVDEFLKRFTFEPNFMPPKAKSKDQKLADKHSSMAEKHRERKEFFSAEWEYNKALKIEPENIRANFGVGTLYMEMGETEKAKGVFKKLAQVEAIFEEENKHIFNEFGITLRKTKMYDEALANYMKALEISPQDENLYFNIARLYYDKEDASKAQEWLEKALNINPDFREARQFKDVLASAGKKTKPDSTTTS